MEPETEWKCRELKSMWCLSYSRKAEAKKKKKKKIETHSCSLIECQRFQKSASSLKCFSSFHQAVNLTRWNKLHTEALTGNREERGNVVGLIWAFISTTATVKPPYKGLCYWCSHNVFIRIVKMCTLAGISAIVSSLAHSHRPFRHFFPAIKRLWSVTTAASLAIGAKPAASACNSLSGQLITNIDISVCVCVCTRSERARGACISDANMSLSGSPVCSADTLSLPCWLRSQNKQFAFSLKAEVHPLEQTRLPVSIWCQTDSRMRFCPSINGKKKSFLSDKSQPRQSFCHTFVCCSKRIPLAGLESGDEALLVLHQLRVLSGVYYFWDLGKALI